MPEIALIVLGLFVLVWIISAVVKASQNGGSKPPGPASRTRSPSDSPRVERTSNSDIDRFMAEIDRLRRRGEGAPAGRGPEASRPAPRQLEPTPRPSQRVEARPGRLAERERERDRERERRDRERDRERERERERRPRPSARQAPPPLPRTEPVPVLRPVAPEAPAPPPPPPPPPAKPARPPRAASAAAAAAAAAGRSAAPPSAILQTLQSVLRSPQGPAAALILAEILGEPPGRRGTVRPPHRPKFG